MSYGLFYKNDGGVLKFLVCRSYKGLKIDKSEQLIICSNKSADTIRTEIDRIKLLLSIHDNPRPKKLSANKIIFISNNSSSYQTNFIGGNIEGTETPEDTFLREFDEELLLNCDDENKKSILFDISGNLTNKILIGDRTVFLINYDTLADNTKLLLSSGVDNIKAFSKLGSVCDVSGIELGEIHSLKWHNLKGLKDSVTIKKFFTDGRLTKKLMDLIIGGGYYKKYIKYKAKYLKLKSI